MIAGLSVPGGKPDTTRYPQVGSGRVVFVTGWVGSGKNLLGRYKKHL